MDHLMETIQARHSTRALFDPQMAVPERDIIKIIEAGRWAPTAHNMQNFEVIVIDDRKILDTLGTITTYPSPDFIRENFEQLSLSEEELRQKKVGILGLQFPPAWREREQLATAMKDRTPGTLNETIKGSPAVLDEGEDPLNQKGRLPGASASFHRKGAVQVVSCCFPLSLVGQI